MKMRTLKKVERMLKSCFYDFHYLLLTFYLSTKFKLIYLVSNKQCFLFNKIFKLKTQSTLWLLLYVNLISH